MSGDAAGEMTTLEIWKKHGGSVIRTRINTEKAHKVK